VHFILPIKENQMVVTGALCRKTDPKIVIALKNQSRSKDQNERR